MSNSWKSLSEISCSNLNSGGEYLVIDFVSSRLKYGYPCIATYYERGDVIHLDLRDDFTVPAPKNHSTKDKNVERILGKQKAYTIPETGFYLIISEYGINEDEENGAFLGCKSQPICIGNLRSKDDPNTLPCLYSELPEAPEGHLYVPQPYKDSADHYIKQLEAEIEDSDIPTKTLSEMLKNMQKDPHHHVRIYEGTCIYSALPQIIANRVKNTWLFAKAMASVSEEEFSEFLSNIKNGRSAEYGEIAKKFMQKHNIPERCAHYLRFCTMIKSDAIPCFYETRDRILKRGGTHSLDNVAIMQEAYCYLRFAQRIARFVKLVALNAPEKILTNELRICIEIETGLFDTSRIVWVDIEKFELYFGISPNGIRCNKRCLLGDHELMAIDSSEEDDESDDDNSDAEAMKNSRYIWSFKPNFMMREEGYPIFDRVDNKYLRDENGNIILYTTRPEEKLRILNQ